MAFRQLPVPGPSKNNKAPVQNQDSRRRKPQDNSGAGRPCNN